MRNLEALAGRLYPDEHPTVHRTLTNSAMSTTHQASHDDGVAMRQDFDDIHAPIRKRGKDVL
jgi:hypothetical protein